VFADLFNLSTYLLPRSRLPALPESVAGELGFAWAR
jgi:tryptophan 2,3-dioxygenase